MSCETTESTIIYAYAVFGFTMFALNTIASLWCCSPTQRMLRDLDEIKVLLSTRQPRV